jgi:tRNA-guanine family transglycosylase
MPVATQAALKGLSQQQTEELGISGPLYAFVEHSHSRKLGISLILNNTYHLNLRPGTKILEKAGGAHEFQGWRRNMLTVCAQEQGSEISSLSLYPQITLPG